MEEDLRWSKSCFLFYHFAPAWCFFTFYRLKILTFLPVTNFMSPFCDWNVCSDMWHVWWSWIKAVIHRLLCERFSLELVSTKEIVPTKTVDSMFCGFYRVTGTVLFWKEMLLLNVFNAASTSNQIPFTSVLLGSSRYLKDWYLKTWANKTKPASMTRYQLEVRKHFLFHNLGNFVPFKLPFEPEQLKWLTSCAHMIL